ncbi:hypothetical protein FHG87_020683 [Trinorchestia longiramus]|nr:hypothetical protein FHG87_020683 [Trinorchestia longiramus]
MSVSAESDEVSVATSVEDECSALKEFLSDVIKDRAALKQEFDQLTESRQLMVEPIEDDDDDSNEDDEQSDGRLLAYQAEKKQLDEKLRILEEKLSLKDKQMAELDLKATEYLHRVTTSSNSLFDEEELEAASGVPCDADEKPNGHSKEASTNVQISSAQLQESVDIPSTPTKEVPATNECPVKTSAVKEFNSTEQTENRKVVPVEEIISLSNLVSELKNVKDEMGRCISVKTKSFAELEDELLASKRNQAELEQQVTSMLERLNAKEIQFQTLVKENEGFKEALLTTSKESGLVKSLEENSEKNNELERKLKSVDTVTERGTDNKEVGERMKVDTEDKTLAKEIVHKNGVMPDKHHETSDLEDSDDRSVSDEKDSPIESSAENLDTLPPDDVFDDYSILEEQNKKLTEKLRSTGRYLKALTRDRELKRKECKILQEKVQLVEGKMLQLQSSFDTLVAAVMTERDDILKEVENKRGEIDRLNKVVELQVSREQMLLENIEEAEKRVKAAELSTEVREAMKQAFEDELSLQKISLESRMKSLQDESLEREKIFLKKTSELEELNKDYVSKISQLQEQIEKLTINEEQSTVVKILTEKVKQKEEDCKILEDRLETQNQEMNEFVTCLKDEMTRMKEDMLKQSDARLQLEVSCDTLMETNREVLIEKNKLEEASVELSIALNDQKNLVESLKEQVEDLSRKNTAISCEFHEKEDEYSDELKARDATIQELKKTLTNNQKQSSENYRCLQEDLAAYQLKLSSQIEESKSTVSDLEQQCALLHKTKAELESKLEESYQLNESSKADHDAAMKTLSSKLDKLQFDKDEEIMRLKCSLEYLQQISETTSNDVKVNDDPKAELLTSWSGSLEELECELSCAKDKLISFICAGQASAGSSTSDSAVNRLKIASMVRRVEELSSVLATTRLGCSGAPVAPACGTDTQKTEVPSSTYQPLLYDTEKGGSDGSEKETSLVKNDKASNTWCPFATQAEFETFVSEKEQKIESFEKQVNELETSLSSKYKYIEELEEKLEAAKNKFNASAENKSFESHLNAVKQLNNDISDLKEELERSHSECDSLKSTIELLKETKPKQEITNNPSSVIELESQIVKKADETEQASGSESQNSELKKNLVKRLKLIVSAIESRTTQDIVSSESSDVDDVAPCPPAKLESISKVVSTSSDPDREIIIQEHIEAILDCCKRQESTLKRKIAELEESLCEVSSNNASMEKKLKLTENKVGVLNEVKRKLMDYTRTLEDKLQCSDDSRVASLTEKKATAHRVDELLNEIQELKQHIDELNAKCDSLLIEKSKESKTYEETREENERLSEKIIVIQDEIRSLESVHSQCANNKQKILDLEEEKTELANQCKNLNSKIIDMEIIEAEQNNRVDALITERNVLQKQYDNLQSTVKLNDSSADSSKRNEENVFPNTSLINNETVPADIQSTNSVEYINHKPIHHSASSEKVDLTLPLSDTTENICDKRLDNQMSSKENVGSSINVEDEKVERLKLQLEKLNADQEALVRTHKEEQQNMLEMQNMMVTDMEKLILSLESEKNTLSESKDNMYVELKSFKEENLALSSKVTDLNATVKYLQDKLHGLEMEKQEFQDQHTQERKILEGLKKTDEIDNVSYSNASKALASQLTISDEKLGASASYFQRGDSGLRSKSASVSDVSSLQQKINDLRRDLTAELDIVESRKDEETQRLENKFADLETEFSRKLAEMKEYYESIIADEKAEFGRLLVTRVSDYEKKLSEKCDEISGWEVKLMTMQEELDNKMIVIEELETRLDERSTPRLDRRFLPISSSPSLRNYQSSSFNDEKFLPEELPDSLKSSFEENKGESATTRESELPSYQQTAAPEAVHYQRPILSLMMSSSYSNFDGLGSRSSSKDSLKIADEDSKHDELQKVSANPKTAVFISRDFPSSSTLQSAVKNLELQPECSKVKLLSECDSDSSSDSSQDDTVEFAVQLTKAPASSSSVPLSSEGCDENEMNSISSTVEERNCLAEATTEALQSRMVLREMQQALHQQTHQLSQNHKLEAEGLLVCGTNEPQPKMPDTQVPESTEPPTSQACQVTCSLHE